MDHRTTLLPIPPQMPPVTVQLDSDVYFALLTHALTTEEEEVMGLLLGTVNPCVDEGEDMGMDMEDFQSSSADQSVKVAGKSIPAPPSMCPPKNPRTKNGTIVKIVYSCTLMRSDKQRDRVEISPEQLHKAVMLGESMSKETGQDIRVVGWYHSHPHITHNPSHVDLNTQYQYQAMDASWVGLIVSCFTENRDKSQTLRLTGFQTRENGSNSNSNKDKDGGSSQRGRGELSELPVRIEIKENVAKQRSLQIASDLAKTLYQEEKAAYIGAYTGSGYLERVHASSVYCKSLCRLLELHTLPLINALRSVGTS